ncbi:Cc8l18.2-like protein [Plakobranchus ocellatus]|uniref:Cc8l18.2-like protein n=1 Tax=Plakobranchus ocellatus TaxID=259542 RepID=A0AAV3Z677_9GAST|nr:Cc8l18.2-like protein [Plakobranchus ocellatus]
MEPQDEARSPVTPRSKYGLRVRLHLKEPEPQLELLPKKKPLSNAERAKRFREKRKADTEKHKLYLEEERKRSQLRRYTMTTEQRQTYNAKAAVRNAKCRSKRRQETQTEAVVTPSRRSTRQTEQLEMEKKEKERQRMQRYRDNMTPQKRRRVNEKRMRRYYAAKVESLAKGQRVQQAACEAPAETVEVVCEDDNGVVTIEPFFTDVEGDCVQVQEVLEDVECVVADQEVQKDDVRIEPFFTDVEGDCVQVQEVLEDVECVVADQEVQKDDGGKNDNDRANECQNVECAMPEVVDPFVKELAQHKHKRDKTSIKFKRLLAKCVKNLKISKYRQFLGLDRRTLNKEGTENLYSKTSKTKPTIQKFFEDNSIFLPHVKTVSKKTLRQKKFLERPISDLYQQFKREHPDCTASIKTFFRHRPDHIVSCKKMPLLQSRCEVCLNPDFKVKALMKLCHQSLELRQLTEMSLCVRSDQQKYHKLSCLNRSCVNCSPDAVRTFLHSLCDPGRSQPVTWQKWDYAPTSGGKKHLELLERQGTFETLVDELVEELKSLPIHQFAHHWQADQYKKLKACPPNGCAVVTLDFAQNYTCVSQDQPQSSYYGMRQVTVHPAVIHRPCPDDCGGVITDNMVFLSNDLKHDAYFVNEVIAEVTRHLIEQNISKAFVFSDGASSQYKAKLPFSLLTNQCASLELERHYFGSRHGKSACDALGGVIKTAARQAVTRRHIKIADAEDMYTFCNSTMTKPVECCCGSSRKFYLVTEVPRPEHGSDANSNTHLKTVPGTRKIHAIQPLASNVINTRSFSCFCKPCLQKDYSRCKNLEIVSVWQKVKLAEPKLGPFSELKEIKDDRLFFDAVQKSLESCVTFEEFKSMCLKVNDLMPSFPLNSNCSVSVEHLKCSVDQLALKVRPLRIPPDWLPLSTIADGNCMPRSLCLAFMGSDRRHKEMRCRIAVELAINDRYYQNGSNLCKHSDGDMPESQIIDVVTKLSDSITSSDENNINVKLTFESEVMKTVTPNTYMGMWQLFAAANVMKVNIVSVYPSLGWSVFQNLHNRVIRPRCGKASGYISVLWSSLREDMSDRNWVANHIVPLIAMTAKSASFHTESVEKANDRNLWDTFQA